MASFDMPSPADPLTPVNEQLPGKKGISIFYYLRIRPCFVLGILYYRVNSLQ